MQKLFVIAVFVLVSRPCCSRPASEDSVVSVYTRGTSDGTPQLNVYGQIATNIAEKITSPIYRFFGAGNTLQQTTKRPFEHIELQELEPTSTNSPGRDVEELSAEALMKAEKKPEKISLFSSYLPIPNFNEKSSKLDLPGKLETPNETRNEIDDDFDDDFDLDDVEDVTPRGPFVYLLDLIGKVLQLLWGGFLWIFNPANSS